MTPAPEYTSRRPPRAHQVEGLRRLRGKRAFALLMGMRTGKTKVAVDDFGAMVAAGEAMDMAVVAPHGAYLPWLPALEADLPPEIWKQLRVFVWSSRRCRTKSYKQELSAFLSWPGPRVLLMNVEAISHVQPARATLADFLTRRRGKNVFAVDESVVIKEATSICGKFCLKVGPLAAYRRILSGLVSPRSPLDLWNQFNFLDPGILGFTNFVAFRERYAEVKQICMVPEPVVRAKLRQAAGVGRFQTRAELIRTAAVLDPTSQPGSWSEGDLRSFIDAAVDGISRDRAIESISALGSYIQTVPKIGEFKNLEELRAKIEPWSYRVRLEDCYDMPASDYSFRDVEWHDEQRRVYDDIRKNATAQLESLDYVTATHVVTQMLRLHQVLCGHVRDEEGKLHEVPQRRVKALLDLLADYEGKAIVWCSYDPDVRRVVAALEKEYGEGSVARFWGGNVKTREQEEQKFKTEPACRFMVATPDAGGRGRDWSAANLTVYYSSRNNLDHRQQSEDRPKAVGKMTALAYVDLRVPNTVEDRIVKCLRDKIDMASVINGDNWREWLV